LGELLGGIFDTFHSISTKLPEVVPSTRPLSIKERLTWVGIALVLFFIMYHTVAFGVSMDTKTTDFVQMITASRFGTLITTGIGPIVMASIFLQLFVGAGLLKLDMSNPKEKQRFQEAQKLLTIIVALFEAIMFVIGGRVVLNNALGPATAYVVILEITLGSIVLMYLDEVVTKYGIGSGISLFIAAGVSYGVLAGAIGLLVGPGGVTEIISSGGAEAIPQSILALMPIVFTVIVFLAVVYSEGVVVEIPLSFARYRGLSPKLPLKFFYLSNIPVIFASAFLVTFNMTILSMMPTVVTQHYTIMNYAAGVLYLFTPIYGAGQTTIDHFNFMFQGVTPIFGLPEWIHALLYVLALASASVLFGTFWAETSNMDSKSMAKQLNSSGLQIPGFRRDPRKLSQILDKYITPLIYLGSFSVGILAGFGDLTGALGTGTGILLTVDILYNMYEQMNKMKVFDLYPSFMKYIE